MKIGVDFHITAGSYQGSKRYLESIFAEVVSQDPDNKYLFLYDLSKHYPPAVDRLGPVKDFGTQSGMMRLFYKAGKLARNESLDWGHFQHYSPAYFPARIALTVHDILFEIYPEYFPRLYRLKAKYLIRQSCKKAEHIFVPSTYTKNEIQQLYHIPPSKITVTPNAVNPLVFHTDNRNDSVEIVRLKFGIDDYILSVGRIEPRKNYLNLIKAYALLKRDLKDIPRLVIVGQRTYAFKGIFKLIIMLGLERDIRIIEDADDETLPHLYRAALLFMYPSFAEGFGIPPLEAMASGCPIITSNITAIPEVVGDAGILIDPDNPGEIAIQMGRLLLDSALREQLSAAGTDRSAKFTWERSAKAIISVYNS